jgi:hypothetical protein
MNPNAEVKTADDADSADQAGIATGSCGWDLFPSRRWPILFHPSHPRNLRFLSIFGMNALIGGTLPTVAGRFRPGQSNAWIAAADELINQRDRHLPPARKPICAFTLTTALRGNEWRSGNANLKREKQAEKSVRVLIPEFQLGFCRAF